ncbi:MAG: PIN domain-containing protein [Candidatus Diapherotrites archaeon]|uniref:PIN domain-containing protein n=1 Tax=Candidatus Iainarchaeum sp. TaxID=3101447 RepID=A0A8T4LGM4_9ARCH|nr:PIN domain-containing protein [Candidatus Diapherotrites archaeon]
MKIVVDASVLFAVMIKAGFNEHLLFLNELEPFAPEQLFAEFRKHKKQVFEETGRTPANFFQLTNILKKRIKVIPLAEFAQCVKEAEALLTDKDDAAYLAACLATNMPLWSNDKGFKRQRRVTVYTTQELASCLGLE